MESSKLSLPAFLKILTSNNVPVPKAMAIAGKIYKEYSTPAKLAELTDVKLIAAGIESKEDRKYTLNAIRKAGYIYKGKPLKRKESETPSESSALPSSSNSTLTTVQEATTPPKKRKRRVSDREVNEFLPDGPQDEAESHTNLEFNEVLDEDVLRTKSTIVNRAPLMTAWSMLIAERLGFQKEEALSIASVYTEMNAVSKGISLGMFDKNRERGMEASRGGSQPYVELMGRRPLYRSKNGQWRALSNGSPVPPGTAFSYIYRSLRQTTPYVVGALKLLADSYSVGQLNGKGWSLYAEFRPDVDGWGKKSEVKCETILNLRKVKDETQSRTELETPPVKAENAEQAEILDGSEPESKKPRTMTLEEYEAALDEDNTFDNVDLDVGI